MSTLEDWKARRIVRVRGSITIDRNDLTRTVLDIHAETDTERDAAQIEVSTEGDGLSSSSSLCISSPNTPPWLTITYEVAPGTPAQAGHGLSDGEREALAAAAWPDDDPTDHPGMDDGSPLFAAVERIAQARYAEGQRDALAEAERWIVTSVPYNHNLRYDGTEDPLASAYDEGLRDAHGILASLRTEADR